eukprot:1196307-Prorocentrum_minimum.AAC.11
MKKQEGDVRGALEGSRGEVLVRGGLEGVRTEGRGLHDLHNRRHMRLPKILSANRAPAASSASQLQIATRVREPIARQQPRQRANRRLPPVSGSQSRASSLVREPIVDFQLCHGANRKGIRLSYGVVTVCGSHRLQSYIDTVIHLSQQGFLQMEFPKDTSCPFTTLEVDSSFGRIHQGLDRCAAGLNFNELHRSLGGCPLIWKRPSGFQE